MMAFIKPIFYGLVLGLLPNLATAQTDISDPSLATETPAEVEPAWQICNETSFLLRLAVATIKDNKMTPRGWSSLRSGACEAVEAPTNSPRYVFAESDPVHIGGIREWAGSTKLCADDDDFSADATIDCALQDLTTRDFFQVDPTERVTTLIEPEGFGDKAEAAGLQRLLRDNGYRISRIDGIMGRQSERRLAQFIEDEKLAVDLGGPGNIDALVEAARTRQADIGLTLCNNTSARIWSAVAFQSSGSWESRGWWLVDVGACLKPFPDPIEGKDLHFYALQENIVDVETADGETSLTQKSLPDKRLRAISSAPSQFCISQSQFSATGREYCSDKGYLAANFRPLPTDKNGAKIVLNESDFTAPNASGLR